MAPDILGLAQELYGSFCRPHGLAVLQSMHKQRGACSHQLQGNLFRLVQSLESIEQELLPIRKQLHQLLGLPMDRPMLRMANALPFGTAGQAIPHARLTGILQCLALCRKALALSEPPHCQYCSGSSHMRCNQHDELMLVEDEIGTPNVPASLRKHMLADLSLPAAAVQMMKAAASA